MTIFSFGVYIVNQSLVHSITQLLFIVNIVYGAGLWRTHAIFTELMQRNWVMHGDTSVGDGLQPFTLQSTQINNPHPLITDSDWNTGTPKGIRRRDDKDWSVGYNEFDFFQKIKNTDPLMGAKFKSKTHLLHMFFYCWRRFLRV